MRRAVKDYRYEVSEGRMTDECNQYLAQMQKDWERQRIKLGVEMARKENRSLFSEACTHKAMVLVSPELLKSKGFQQVLDNTQFQNCILFMAVDEAHLLNSWGKTFQKAFEQIVWM